MPVDKTGVAERSKSALGLLISSVCDTYQTTPEELRSTARLGHISRARWALAFILVEDWGWSYLRVGKLIAKSHVAALLGYNNAKALMSYDGNFYQSIIEIREAVR